MNINEHLAVKVMGWHRPPLGTLFERLYYYSNYKCIDRISPVDDWSPQENIEQAIMCLNSFKTFGISKNMVDEGYYVSIYPDFHDCSEFEFEAENQSLPKAISLACARATGWEDE